MTDLTDEYATVYHVTKDGFNAWPLFGDLCQDRNEAAKEARRMIKNGETGVKLISTRIRGDMSTGFITRDREVEEHL